MMNLESAVEESRMIHCWDPTAHKILCGVRQQIGSTKHVRDVTCSECLGLLGRTPTPPVHSTTG